jgi:hypothetical protein
MLIVLTLLGIAATTTSTIEVQISGNDKLFKQTFAEADGGTEVGGELIEQNIEDRNWPENHEQGDVKVLTAMDASTGNIYMNRESDLVPPDEGQPSDTNRDAYFPKSAGTNVAHTNLRVVGNTRLSTGSAVQMAAGYEGKGKAAAGGGAWVVYDVRAQHIKPKQKTKAQVRLQWRHVL